MKRPTISLCMFARNEAATIREAIESVRPLCDEIVIGIDSTSSDDTETIAAEYADVIYTFDWNGSFSDARNLAMSKCAKEWLLIWDAHEWMSPEHVEKLRDKMWQVIGDDCPAIGFKLLMEDGAVGMQTRLLKNKIGWKYDGKVHNQLNSGEVDPDGISMGFRDLIIEHRPTKENRKIRKKERYEQIERDMGAILKENPEDIRSAFYLASIAHEQYKFRKAIRLYKTYLKNSKDVPDGDERYLVTWQIGRCRMALGQEEKAKKVFHECIAMRYEIPLAYTTLGEIAVKEATATAAGTAKDFDKSTDENESGQRKWSEAEDYFKRAIALAEENPMPDSTVFYPGAFYSWLPVWNLGKLYELNAMYDQALYCVLKARKFGDFPPNLKDKAGEAIITLRSVIREQLTAKDEQVSKVATIHEGKPKLVIFDSFGSFTSGIADSLDGAYTVLVSKEFNPSLAWWADIIWFDFCDANIVEATRMSGWEQQIICRVHGFEAYDTPIGERVNWECVDDLIFVSKHVKNDFLSKFPAAEAANIHVIPNGIDLSKWKQKKRLHGKRLGFAGYLKPGKNAALLLNILIELPDDHILEIAGEWQDDKEEKFFKHLTKRLGLSKRVSVEPWQSDMNKWFEGIDYFVSTSISESFSYVICEAMAKGIKPVIIDRPGAKELWGEEFLFHSVSEAAAMMLPASDYDSKHYRKVAQRYSIENQMQNIRGILKGRKSKREAA
ncbi:MAG: glycosyltransferase [Candidatus Marinimicrobia bacterium]|nr:glycosyltransferase [Candidatus Neomarinimicrobiota bacterium]